jgi:hypothetical protein
VRNFDFVAGVRYNNDPLIEECPNPAGIEDSMADLVCELTLN